MKVPEPLLPYLDEIPDSQEAIELFHRITARGEQPYCGQLPKDVGLQLSDLLYAHSVASRPFSEVLEGLWVEDMQLGLLLTDYLRDWYGKGYEYWMRRRPLWQRAYALTQRARGHVKERLEGWARPPGQALSI